LLLVSHRCIGFGNAQSESAVSRVSAYKFAVQNCRIRTKIPETKCQKGSSDLGVVLTLKLTLVWAKQLENSDLPFGFPAPDNKYYEVFRKMNLPVLRP